MYIEELTEAKIQELETMFEKEIFDYQNKIICKQKFIYLIKEKCKIIEFCYLYQKYIGEIKSVIKIPEFSFSENDYIETVNKENEYNNRINKKSCFQKNIKKLVRIENMAQKKTYYKRCK